MRSVLTRAPQPVTASDGKADLGLVSRRRPIDAGADVGFVCIANVAMERAASFDAGRDAGGMPPSACRCISDLSPTAGSHIDTRIGST